MKKWRLIVLLLILALSFAFPGSAKITVFPLTIIMEVPPGRSSSGFFVVVNDGTVPEEVTISVADWSLETNGNIQFLNPGTLSRSLAKYIQYAPVSFKLAPGEKQKVDFTFTIPEGESGDHWALFFVEGSEVTPIASTTGEVQSTVGAKVRYGIKIFQRDPGAVRNGRISGMEFLEQAPLKLKVVFENTGTAVLRDVTGWVEIRDEQGETVRRIEIERFTVLPGAKRELEVIDPKAERLPAGSYVALAVIDFGGDFLVAGELPFKID